jgi:hypothetical protein
MKCCEYGPWGGVFQNHFICVIYASMFQNALAYLLVAISYKSKMFIKLTSGVYNLFFLLIVHQFVRFNFFTVVNYATVWLA